MRKTKSYKYKNYGPTPQNEYTTTSSGRNDKTSAVLGVDSQAGDTAHTQRLIKRKAQRPPRPIKISGWLRTWKVNGWRAESAALYDEDSDLGRYST